MVAKDSRVGPPTRRLQYLEHLYYNYSGTMKQTIFTRRIGNTRLTVDPIWYAGLLVLLGTTAILYVPIMAPAMSRGEAWSLAVVLAFATGCCLVAHTVAHVTAARLLRCTMPARTPIHLIGDAAHVWPAGPTPWKEAGCALAGPLFNGAAALFFYLLWDQQLHPYVDLTALFLVGANGAVALFNLSPMFPLDGGRLTRALIWGFLQQPRAADRMAYRLGWGVAGLFALWGALLLFQSVRFSNETGGATLVFAGVLARALRRRPARWQAPASPVSPVMPWKGRLREMIAGLLILVMGSVPLGTLPTVNGLTAPGLALSVEPMIVLDPDYRHQPAGSFLLTTVVEQIPILTAQYVYGRISPVVDIVPPEQVLPADTSPQQWMQQNYRWLEESQTAAAIVALEQAGYGVTILGQGVEVVGFLPESPARTRLRRGDVIVAVDGQQVRSTQELIEYVSALPADREIEIVVMRDGDRRSFLVPLMAPASADESPRIGISVRTVGTDVVYPFSLEIRPKKIVGGPSAGLMFALTLYNLLTPEDITGGRLIAGTGTIALDGTVEPIGGVEQKVAAAERAGADYFLVPRENYEDARRVARGIDVISVATMEEALNVLRTLGQR